MQSLIVQRLSIETAPMDSKTPRHSEFCEEEGCIEAWEYEIGIDHGDHECVTFLCRRHMLEMTKYQPDKRPARSVL